MKKTFWKPLIITLVAIVVCIGLALLITLLPDSSDEESSPSPSSSTPPTSTYLINEDYYDLDYIKVHFRDDPGADLEIHTYLEEEQQRFSVEPAVEGWTYSHDSLSSTAWNAVSVTALAKVAESTDDLAYYGLDDPMYVFEIAFKSGANFTLRIGDLTAVADSYYGMIDDDPSVYAVSKYSIQKMSTNELSYRELNFFDTSVYLDQETMTYDANGGITYIKLYNENLGLNFELRQRTADELAGDLPAGTTTWHMFAPVDSECNDTNVEDSFIDKIVPLTIESVITDVADETMLSEYGFDDPIELWMENADGETVHYYIGNYTETGDCYVMAEGCNSVLYASGFAPAVLETNYIDLMFKLLWIENISDVSRIEYTLGDTKRLLSIIENYTDEDGNDVFYATLDGRAISVTNARRLFTYALNLLIVGDLDEAYSTGDAAPEYSIAIVMNDGTRNTLDLYAMNERQYAASVNGAPAVFYVNVSDIRALLTAFDYQDRGEEIPRS